MINPLQGSPGVASATEHPGNAFQIDRMSKWLPFQHVQLPILAARQEGVTGLARLAYYPAIRADMLTIVTAEATRVVQVPDIVGVRMPIDLHIWEKIALVDLLDLGDGPVDLSFHLRVDLGIVATVEGIQIRRD